MYPETLKTLIREIIPGNLVNQLDPTNPRVGVVAFISHVCCQKYLRLVAYKTSLFYLSYKLIENSHNFYLIFKVYKVNIGDLSCATWPSKRQNKAKKYKCITLIITKLLLVLSIENKCLVSFAFWI